MEPIAFERRKKLPSETERVCWSRYNVVVPPTDAGHLLYNTCTGKLVASSVPFDDIRGLYTTPQELRSEHRKLKELGFLVAEYVDELAVVRQNLEEKKHARAQHLLILPTEKCNFRCVYCYEDYSKGRMSFDLQEGLIKWVTAAKLGQVGGKLVRWRAVDGIRCYRALVARIHGLMRVSRCRIFRLYDDEWILADIRQGT